jgi:hypothetical protein
VAGLEEGESLPFGIVHRFGELREIEFALLAPPVFPCPVEDLLARFVQRIGENWHVFRADVTADLLPVAERRAAEPIEFRQVGDRVQVVGDDYLVTSAARVRQAAALNACNAALIKPNQAGTLTETRAAFDAAKDAGWRTIISARSGETEDVTIVHLAVGWRSDQLKVGSFARSERMAKWNEALRIEGRLGGQSVFAHW